MCKQVGTMLVLLGLALTSLGADGEKKAAKTGKPFLGLAVEPSPGGLAVRAITVDSPAANANFKLGDIIQKVGGAEVREYDQLLSAIARHKPGDMVDVQVQREGKSTDLTVTLGERSVLPAAQSRPASYLGVWTRPLTPDIKAQFGIESDKGVAVAHVSPESPAAQAGLKRGDVILKAGSKEIADPRELQAAVAQTGAGKDLTLQIQRGKETRELTAQLREPTADAFSRPPAFRDMLSLPQAQKKIAELEQEIRDLRKRIKQLEEKSDK